MTIDKLKKKKKDGHGKQNEPRFEKRSKQNL